MIYTLLGSPSKPPFLGVVVDFKFPEIGHHRYFSGTAIAKIWVDKLKKVICPLAFHLPAAKDYSRDQTA